MKDFRGMVNGIDAQASGGQNARCQAFINESAQNYIQVTTLYHSLQTALETASIKNIEVEVTYDDSSPENMLTRVRLLDR